MIAMIREILDLAGERKKQLYLAWLFQALTSICEGAIYFMLFLCDKRYFGRLVYKGKTGYSIALCFWSILSCILFLLLYDCKAAPGILCHDAG